MGFQALKTASIHRWIGSVDPTQPDAENDDLQPRAKRVRSDDLQPRPKRARTDDVQRAKCARIDASSSETGDTAPTCALPNTPSPTDPTMSYTQGGRKRNNSDDTSLWNAAATPPLQPEGTSQSSSQSTKGNKRSRPNPTKTRSTLALLDTPVNIKALNIDTLASLPADIEPLYRKIHAGVSWRQRIVPAEVQHRMEKKFKDRLPDYIFCDPVSDGPEAEGEELHRFRSLCDILIDTGEANKHQVHEDYWNMMVNSPLLRLVFKRREKGEQEVVARYLPAMSLAIASDSSPWFTSEELDVNLSSQQCDDRDASTRDSGGTPCNCSQTEQTGQTWFTGQTNRGRDGKKVDYLVVLEIDEEAELHKAIAALVNRLSLKDGIVVLSHVNQSTYAAITYKPIAASVETKRQLPSSDALVQLAIWIATWYKRMHNLRWELSLSKLANWPDAQPDGGQPDAAHQNHEDRDESARPVVLGSTRDIISLHALVASLEAVKRWIET
ncbi:Uu.00g104890.m01.CDS01 [Anthostomella pinea]|uniref:Uu.00g104890.m01.CDS01 n=1 Tax=Anthostomella pinea TaxID=933095 RepID=A0AAI8V8R4_9PEZI|nr:Uu.00g104890.m01.CDS01 [Anthostomella pinea]